MENALRLSTFTPTATESRKHIYCDITEKRLSFLICSICSSTFGTCLLPNYCKSNKAETGHLSKHEIPFRFISTTGVAAKNLVHCKFSYT